MRTKYDRMFQRKNQNVLSSHYTKLIDRDSFGNENDPEDEDFITLKRANHDLEDDIPPLDTSAELSKRKLKLSRTKRMIAKNGVNTKLIFDDEGKAHQLYELADGEEWLEGKGMEGAKEEGKKFAEEERGKMKLADVVDKAEARQKKKEKKRKRKERERMIGGDLEGASAGPVLGLSEDEDDGYVSPEFDLPESDFDDDYGMHSPPKRGSAQSRRESPPPKKRKTGHSALEDEEELALRLLEKR